MNKQNLIQSITFGESIAEQESEKLKNYFFKTEFWNLVRNGTTDIIYGAKGAGKSALYTSIVNDTDALFDEGILVSLAENPTGNTAFSNLKNDPPTSETQFVRLWKLYFLVITANEFNKYEINDKSALQVLEILRDCNLVPAQNKLSGFLKVCMDFVRSIQNGKEFSTTAEFDSMGMYSGQKFSISFGEPSKSDFDKGLVSIEYAHDLLQKSLLENKIKLWIIIDRLDVAFTESEELETNALRALFKAYLDLVPYSEIKFKIFLRDDIWDKINNGGFREASHITKYQNLRWSKESLLNLLIRRIIDNSELVTFLNINKEDTLSNFSKQENLFYTLFPKQIDVGTRKSNTLDWILSRTKDGKGINTPRELVQLLKHAREIELKSLENGINDLTDNLIISKQSFKKAVDLVSRQRMEQTIYAEFPTLKEYMEALRKDKAEHSIDTLSIKWSKSKEETFEIAKNLQKIGFFEEKGERPNLRFKIPFIYRPFLQITQGAANSDIE